MANQNEIMKALGKQDKITEKWNGVLKTSNPLRVREPGVMLHAQSNVWGEEDSAQKVWQHLAMSADRCKILAETIILHEQSNDFTKRTIASYFVLELHSIFEMLQFKTSQRSGLDTSSISRSLRKQIKQLMKPSSEFCKLRNKLIAHLDGDISLLETGDLWMYLTRERINEWGILVGQLLTELYRIYPDEWLTHIGTGNIIMPGLLAPIGDTDYIPF